MDRNFARALALVLKSEGGWSDSPADPGGATMKGVTLANFRRYVKADASKADLRKMINFRKLNLVEAWPTMPVPSTPIRTCFSSQWSRHRPRFLLVWRRRKHNWSNSMPNIGEPNTRLP